MREHMSLQLLGKLVRLSDTFNNDATTHDRSKCTIIAVGSFGQIYFIFQRMVV